MRSISIALLSVVLVLFCREQTLAVFHLMQISEVMAQAGGDPRVQFVELTMISSGQNLVTGTRLLFFDAAGNLKGEFAITRNVSSGANGAAILFGTQTFADRSTVVPDFIIPDCLLDPFSGRVCFNDEGGFENIDCLAYGDYTGSNGSFGAPAARFPIIGSQSLTRINPTGPNATAFAFRDPSPRNNAGATGAVNAPDPACFIEDGTADPANWDLPAPNAGLDLANCGAAVKADIGRVEVAGGKLILTPGTRDDLMLGLPIAFTGLSNNAALLIDEQNYRAQFDLLAHQGIVIAAVFTRQHYLFNEAAKTIDVSMATGMGINFSFDSITETSDHLHADARGNCISSVRVDGANSANFGFLLKTETRYRIILDVDGDDEQGINGAGTLTLLVKFFPADQPEPLDYLATFKLASGLQSPIDSVFDHGVFIAALGQAPGTMEISDFSVCEIPRNHKKVRSLVCTRLEDGSITVRWQNPSDADTRKDIRILVNGRLDQVVPGSTTETVLDDPPAGDAVISVINDSCVAAVCTVCKNDPPVVVIGGPTAATLPDGGKVVVALDSAGSTDGDGGASAISIFWEVISRPAGATPMINDPLSPAIQLTLDEPGDYTVKLTITDAGCPEDLIPLSTSAEHRITVRPEVVGGGRFPNDCNQDGAVDISDPVCLLSHLFLGNELDVDCGVEMVSSPAVLLLLDANQDGGVDISDPVVVLGHLFLGEPPPLNGPPLVCKLIAGCESRCNP